MFRLLEQSRARVWRDRVKPDAGAPALAAVQARLPADALLLEYWVGSAGMALLWMSHDAAGVTRGAGPADRQILEQLSEAVAQKDSDWRPASVAAGHAAAGAPAAARQRPAPADRAGRPAALRAV